jgi:GGDEF domain-containing protein
VAEGGGRVCGVSFLRLSAGAAFFPQDGRNAEELLATADARMYEMKHRHHGEATVAAGLEKLAEAVAARAERHGRVPLSSPQEER